MTKETITEEEFKHLKEEVEQAKVDHERAKGALSELMNQLKKEFGCDSFKEANTLLQKLIEKSDAAQKEYEKAFTNYRETWHGSKE